MSKASVSPIASACCSSFVVRIRFVGSFFFFIVMMPVPVVASALVTTISVVVIPVVAVSVAFAIVVETVATSIVAMVVVTMIVAATVAAGWLVFVFGARTSISSTAFTIIPNLLFQGRETVSNILKRYFQVVEFGGNFSQQDFDVG